MKKLLEEQWNDFKNSCLSHVKSENQKEAMRMVFYAGASAMFGLAVNTECEDDEEGAKILESLHNECTDFLKETNKKREEYENSTN